MVTGQGDSIVAQPSAELFSVGNHRLLKVEQRADLGPLLLQRATGSGATLPRHPAPVCRACAPLRHHLLANPTSGAREAAAGGQYRLEAGRSDVPPSFFMSQSSVCCAIGSPRLLGNSTGEGWQRPLAQQNPDCLGLLRLRRMGAGVAVLEPVHHQPQRPKVKILGAQQTRAYGLAEDHWLRSPQLGGDRHRPVESRLSSRLRACTLSGQHGETAIAVEVQGRMIRIAKPIPVRTA